MTPPVIHHAADAPRPGAGRSTGPRRDARPARSAALRRRGLGWPLLLALLVLGVSGNPEPLLLESFSSPAVAWTLPHPPGAQVAVTGGTLTLDLSGPHLDLVSYAPGPFGNARMEATLARQGASHAMAGLICRAPDTRRLQGHAFLLRGDGQHGVVRFGDGAAQLLSRGQLGSRPAGPLRLALECVGDRLAAFVDGNKVAELRGLSLPPEGLLGSVALTQGDPQAFTARFDDVRVTAAQTVSGPLLAAAPPRTGDVLQRESFSDPASGWPVDERALYHYVDERLRYHYVDGQYRITPLGQRAVWSITDDLLRPAPADVRAEVTLTLGPGPAGGAGGLTCRQVVGPEGTSSFYAFTVAADGAAHITPFTDDRAEVPVAQAPAGTVLVQVGRPLRLRVECVGDRLALLVGDQKVVEVHDRRLTGPGQVGVMATQPEALDQGATVALFDDLVLIQP